MNVQFRIENKNYLLIFDNVFVVTLKFSSVIIVIISDKKFKH